jgi:transposase
MNRTTIAVDLAKSVFQLSVADGDWRVQSRHRLSRAQVVRFFSEPQPCDVVIIPGIGLLTATALIAAVGDVSRFPSARHFASWLGLTPRESSSGTRRRLGGISKQGDRYLRTLLIHGGRSVLAAAHRAKEVDHLRRWALAVERQRGRNRAAVALANRLARLAWAVWRHDRDFESRPLQRAA